MRSLRRIANAMGIAVAALTDAETAAKDEPPKFLRNRGYQDEPADVVSTIREASLDDMHSNFAGAELRYERALQATSPKGASRAQLTVRRATVLDNNGRSREALALLEPLLHDSSWRITSRTKHWVRYHIALAHRRLAELKGENRQGHLERSRALFLEVESNGDPEQRIAAGHQLGCVALVHARIDQHRQRRDAARRRAERYFKRSREKWRHERNFREGYSLRRLAEIAREKGNHLDEHSYLLDALEVFVRDDCFRYRDQVRHELNQFVARRPKASSQI